MGFFVGLGIVVCGCVLIVSIVRAMRDKRLSEQHALLWLMPTPFIILGGLFPDAVIWLASRLGIDYAPSMVFTFAILLLYYLLFQLTQWISTLSQKVQELAMQVSLLNQEAQTRSGALAANQTAAEEQDHA